MSISAIYFRRKNPYYGGDGMGKGKKKYWWLVETDVYDEEGEPHRKFYLVRATGPIAAKRKIVAACFNSDEPEGVVDVEKIEEDAIVCIEEDEYGEVGCAKIFK